MKGETEARGKQLNMIVINWLHFVGIILENEFAGNGEGRDSIAPANAHFQYAGQQQT